MVHDQVIILADHLLLGDNQAFLKTEWSSRLSGWQGVFDVYMSGWKASFSFNCPSNLLSGSPYAWHTWLSNVAMWYSYFDGQISSKCEMHTNLNYTSCSYLYKFLKYSWESDLRGLRKTNLISLVQAMTTASIWLLGKFYICDIPTISVCQCCIPCWPSFLVLQFSCRSNKTVASNTTAISSTSSFATMNRVPTWMFSCLLGTFMFVLSKSWPCLRNLDVKISIYFAMETRYWWFLYLGD